MKKMSENIEATLDDAIYCVRSQLGQGACEECRLYQGRGSLDLCDDVNETILAALEELQQYRATGLTPQMVQDLIKSEKQAHKIALENAHIADEYKALEEQGLLLRLPITVKDVVDKLFSHNELISLWQEVKEETSYHELLWRGMAWDIPNELKNCKFVKIFGTIPESIAQADIINIEVVLSEESKDDWI